MNACVGLAGEVKHRTMEAARCGIAGLNDMSIVNVGRMATDSAVMALPRSGLGIAGNMSNRPRAAFQSTLLDPTPLKRRDESLASLSKASRTIGDRAARSAWSRAVWFADWSYLVKRNGKQGLTWREGRDAAFLLAREIPLIIDSSGFRREISGSAPAWTHDYHYYPAAIDLIQPDGYAAWDYPQDRSRSLAALHDLMSTFPDDVTNGRMWPVFSIRWTWDDQAPRAYHSLPSWLSTDFASLIPLNRTQRQYTPETRAEWAELALSNALVMARDPDFCWMVEHFGRVMIGGLIQSKCPRAARHLFAAALCHLFPDVQLWLLGQANFAVVNGLGRLGLLDRIYTDGSWWLKDSCASRLAVLEDGLITMLSLESNYRLQHFFTLAEVMAANLRSLLSAYQTMWEWPKIEPMPIRLLDDGKRLNEETCWVLKTELQEAQRMLQLELPTDVAAAG